MYLEGDLVFENYIPYELDNFKIETLYLSSQCLKDNPLKDSNKRHIPVLVPKNLKKNCSVVFILAGFTGVGSKYFNVRFKEPSLPQVIDQANSQNKSPSCLYVFIDAMTYWGGSQFINSKGTGNYEDFIVKEIYKSVCSQYPVSTNPKQWCLFGGSSGGYGALHLCSKYPDKFATAVSIAPDSYFEMSLLPELLTALPVIERFGGVRGVKKELEAGKFLNRRDAHSVLNAIGMGTCYAPDPSKKGEVLWPINHEGEKNTHWNKWKKHDPVEFLQKRTAQIKKLHKVYIDVGTRDQYFLQYGSRQILNVLKTIKTRVSYTEFNGNHFDISERRPQALKWLSNQGF